MRKTPLFIFLGVMAIAVYDVWIIFEYGNQESISAHILAMGEIIPQLVLMLGYTMGHLTFPRKVCEDDKKKLNKYSYIFFGLNGSTALYDMYQLFLGSGIEGLIFNGYQFTHAPLFIVGYILGHFLWAMPFDKWKGKYK